MKAGELIQKIKEGDFDEKFLDIYVDRESAALQQERYQRLLDEYIKAFGNDEVGIYSAPGRTEIGGNHTDHQHGHVLAAAINKDAIAVTSPSDDDLIRLISDGYPLIEVDIKSLEPDKKDEGTTKALIRGVLCNLKERGCEIGGFKAYVTSDVLIGAGLSSSAAFENLIGTVISYLYNGGSIPAETIAMAGQYAENVHFGKPCGLMDQMASAVGGLVHIDFKDPADPVIEKTEFDFEEKGWSLCITDTKGSHADLTPEYAAVPAEMKSVAEYLGKGFLADVSEKDIMDNISQIRKKCGDRALLRALHFCGETKRALLESEALKEGKLDEFLRLVKESGDSSFKYLQNVYAPKAPADQGVSVGLCVSSLVLRERGASRVHGGGFAGTIQAWVPHDMTAAYKEAMDKVFGKGACVKLSVRKYGGIEVTGL